MLGLTSHLILGQMPASTAGEIGAWLVPAAAVLWIVVQVRSLFTGRTSEKREVTFGDQFVTKESCAASHVSNDERVTRVEIEIREIRTQMRSDRDQILAAGDDRARRLHIRIDNLGQLFNDKFQEIVRLIGPK
jgi:hypothetical protein